MLGGYVFAMWCGGWRPGQPMPAAGPIYLAATTMTLAGIVACQAGNVLSCRSSTQPIWRLGLTTNPMVLAGIGLELLASRAHLHRSPSQDLQPRAAAGAPVDRAGHIWAVDDCIRGHPQSHHPQDGAAPVGIGARMTAFSCEWL